MLRPAAIKFTGLTMNAEYENAISNDRIKVTPTDWTRVSFDVPNNQNAYNGVCDWLAENCTGRYSIFKFHNTKNYSEFKVSVRFEHANEAVLFKLSDGHRAWELNKAP